MIKSPDKRLCCVGVAITVIYLPFFHSGSFSVVFSALISQQQNARNKTGRKKEITVWIMHALRLIKC